MMRVVLDSKYAWKKRVKDGLTCWYIGSERPVEEIVSFWQSHYLCSPQDLANKLRYIVGNFALLMQDGDRLLACVDKIRSYPVFYVEEWMGGGVSNSARTLKKEFHLTQIDDLSLLEFRMAGYVTGRDSLYRGLHQLQAGEFLLHEKEVGKTTRCRYYLFYSEETRGEEERQLVEELEDVTNRIFSRIMEEAGGAPIWIPLSGGLDSRLVLCKLKQLGYDNLHAFSYGPLFNHEAKWARKVAEKVGVPWLFIPYRPREIRRFFHSDLRREYWRFSGEFACLPFMVDEFAIRALKVGRLVGDDAVFVNGQSGDFITGGHSYGYHMNLPPEGTQEYPLELITRAIIGKHYSMDSSLLERENQERITEKILRLLNLTGDGKHHANLLVKHYERWEWQERQSKFVVNGQRSYDFFGHRWFLPLWADEYLFFWEKIGYPFKFRQRLYKAYLAKMDFYGVFREFKGVVWNWQGPSMIAIPVGAALKRLFGEGISRRFYHYASYFGKYQNHYAPFGFLRWVRRARRIKSPLVFYVDTFLKDEGIR